MTEAEAVFDLTADLYVGFVGTEVSEATEGPIDRSLLLAFVEMVRARPYGLVADVGCGPGRVASLLAKHDISVIGLDVSEGLLAHARAAHPALPFENGQLDDLPLDDGSLVGAVCWYSIIHTPPSALDVVFGELARVLEPGGLLLLAFQEGDGEAVRRLDAQGSGLPLSSYRHSVDDVADRLCSASFNVHATTRRDPELDHETTPQAFVFAHRA
ncbi:MAG: class I SAM-dependent methyltransferase [Aquihabitans sp.]